jgi:DNA-binding NarL/FixJ family response regulator
MPHWHDGESGGHVVQFYSEDAFLLEALSKLIGTALVAGNAAVVIATQSHLDDLADRLASRALSVSKAAREGRYIALNAAETLAKFMRNGQPDADSFAAVIGPVLSRAAAAVSQESRVVAFGEMVALLWAEGNIDAAIRLEQLWNDLARRHAFSLHCAYPITGFHDKTHEAPFLKICSEHSAVIPGESYTGLLSDQDRLRNIAELQQKAQALETEKALLQALRQAKELLENEVAERREAQRKLHDSELSLRDLSAHLLRTQDAERRRLGRELHDTVGQYLAVLKMGLDSLNVVILDVTMPGMSGLEAASRIIALGTGTRILIFTMHESQRIAVDVREAGAHAFVQKSQAARDLILAVERLLAGGTFFSSEPNDQPGIQKSDKPASAAKAAPNSGLTFCNVFSFA